MLVGMCGVTGVLCWSCKHRPEFWTQFTRLRGEVRAHSCNYRLAGPSLVWPAVWLPPSLAAPHQQSRSLCCPASFNISCRQWERTSAQSDQFCLLSSQASILSPTNILRNIFYDFARRPSNPSLWAISWLAETTTGHHWLAHHHQLWSHLFGPAVEQLLLGRWELKTQTGDNCLFCCRNQPQFLSISLFMGVYSTKKSLSFLDPRWRLGAQKNKNASLKAIFSQKSPLRRKNIIFNKLPMRLSVQIN